MKEIGRERSKIKQSTHTHKIIVANKHAKRERGRERHNKQHTHTIKKRERMEGRKIGTVHRLRNL